MEERSGRTVNRTFLYSISEADHGLRIEQFLRRRGYSRQNLTELKKMPDSIQVNGLNCILCVCMCVHVRVHTHTHTQENI